jgi:hypothetical protein
MLDLLAEKVAIFKAAEKKAAEEKYKDGLVRDVVKKSGKSREAVGKGSVVRS